MMSNEDFAKEPRRSERTNRMCAPCARAFFLATESAAADTSEAKTLQPRVSRKTVTARHPLPVPRSRIRGFFICPRFLLRVPRAFRSPASVSERPASRRRTLNRIPRSPVTYARGSPARRLRRSLSNASARSGTHALFRMRVEFQRVCVEASLRVSLLFLCRGTRNHFSRSFFCLSGKVL